MADMAATQTQDTTIQEQTGEERVDYNALDDTTGGRALQSAFIAAFVAVPDYAPKHRRVTRAAIAAAALGTIAVFNAFDEDPRNDLTAMVASPASTETGSPAKTWGLAAAVAGSAVGVVKLFNSTQRALAKRLSERGRSLPNTRIGLAVGLAAFIAGEAQSH